MTKIISYTSRLSKVVRISWLWLYIHYLSIPLYANSWSEPSRHTLYSKVKDIEKILILNNKNLIFVYYREERNIEDIDALQSHIQVQPVS